MATYLEIWIIVYSPKGLACVLRCEVVACFYIAVHNLQVILLLWYCHFPQSYVELPYLPKLLDTTNSYKSISQFFIHKKNADRTQFKYLFISFCSKYWLTMMSAGSAQANTDISFECSES